MPVERFHEGRFHLCHRHRCNLRPADAGSEEASIPLSVERAGGCGRRLSGQLLGDPSGIAEMQQPLAFPGDRAAPQRHGHRPAQLGDLQPGAEDLGPDSSRTQPSAPLQPRLALPTPVAPTHRHGQVC